MVTMSTEMTEAAVRAEVISLADQFWGRVRDAFPFPRDIERAAMLAFPVAVVKLPGLTVHRIASWLQARGAGVVVPLCDGEMAGSSRARPNRRDSSPNLTC